MLFTAFILCAILVSLLAGAIWCAGYALGWWPRKWPREQHPSFFTDYKRIGDRNG